MTTAEAERAMAAALAITFDDPRMRRQLALRHPEALVRARWAIELLERRERRAAAAGTLDEPDDELE